MHLGRKSGFKCCDGKLLARKDILRKYLRKDITLQVEALYALQEINTKYNKPKGMYRTYDPYYQYIYSHLSVVSSLQKYCPFRSRTTFVQCFLSQGHA